MPAYWHGLQHKMPFRISTSLGEFIKQKFMKSILKISTAKKEFSLLINGALFFI